MSDSDRMNLAYAEETVFGSDPSTPALINLRFTSESLAQVTGTVNSAEIRSDRQIVDHIRTTINVAGDMNIELSYSAFDDFLEAGLLSADWSNSGADITLTAATISAVNSTNSIDDSGSGLAVFTANRWIKVTGFTGAGTTANGFLRIVSVAAGSLVVTGAVIIDDAAGESVTITEGPAIVNGTEQRSFVFEKEYTDLTNIFAKYNGCMIDSVSLVIPSDNIVTGTFGILGKIEVSTAATIDAAGGNTAAPANEVMAGIEDITAILESNSANTGFASTQFSFTLSNNLRQRLQIGILGPISVGSGTVDVSGTLQAYFDSQTIIDKHLNFTDSSLAIQFADSTGKGYVIDFPRVNYDSANRVAGGQNQDILADMNFSAFRNSSQSETIVIQRFAA